MKEKGKLKLAMLLLVESLFLMRYMEKKCKFEKKYVNIAKTTSFHINVLKFYFQKKYI